jgi:arylsulfatase
MKMYHAQVNDGEWEGKAGEQPRRVVEHFGYKDLATIDDEQAASAQSYIHEHAGKDRPFFMYVAFMKGRRTRAATACPASCGPPAVSGPAAC